MTKKERRSLSVDGLPIDGRQWLEEDWADLHRAIETVKQKVSDRHKSRCKVCGWPLAKTAADGCVVGNCSQRS